MGMDDTPGDVPLTFDEFPTPTFDEWRKAAVDSLGGRPIEKLVSTT
jgi:hypothetical protein